MIKNKGFTLIEMLVVIAVVGILSATVLTALGPARNKAKDARVISGLHQARAVAESLFDGDYGALPANGSIGTADTNFGKTVGDIVSQGGDFLKVQHDTDSNDPYYLFWSDLNSNGFYCVDSIGTVKEISSEPGAAAIACP